MNLAPPIPRFGRPSLDLPRSRGADGGGRGTATDDRRSANRSPVRSSTNILQRERHQPDYMILVVVVALTAIGILMVYSSSAMRGYLSSSADTFAVVGPQIQWAILGIVAMVAMMRIDYRYLRLASVPIYGIAVGLLILVFVPAYSVVIGGSARWLKFPVLPAIHPAEMAKLALVIYLAHWFAKRGTKIGGFWSGLVPFLIIVAPVIVLVFREPDLGTTIVISLTVFMLFFVPGANTPHVRALPGFRGPAPVVFCPPGVQP